MSRERTRIRWDVSFTDVNVSVGPLDLAHLTHDPEDGSQRYQQDTAWGLSLSNAVPGNGNRGAPWRPHNSRSPLASCCQMVRRRISLVPSAMLITRSVL
jgi:hypothetical protein